VHRVEYECGLLTVGASILNLLLVLSIRFQALRSDDARGDVLAREELLWNRREQSRSPR
jgi:hypothetical protein